MASLADLLRYKEQVVVRNPRTGKEVAKVWIRVLGDLDLTKAYKAARIASAEKRAALRNPETDDYKDEVMGVYDLDLPQRKDLIMTSKLSGIVAEASVAIERPDLPKLEEVAAEPDAASLEELERLDKLERETEEEYQKKIDEYIETKTTALSAELDALSEEELTEMAKLEVSNLVPFSMFVAELNAQKIFYGAYNDEACKERTFNTIEEFKQLPKTVQEALIIKMNELEISGQEIKN